MTCRAALAFVLCLGWGSALAGEPQRLTLPAGGGLRLSADELTYQPGHRRLELRGKVSLELGTLRLRAARLTVELDPGGQPARAQAEGQIDLRAGDATGRAARAAVQLATRVLELSGAAHVTLGRHGLELDGDRIEVDLASGGLRVRSARARMEAPARRGASHAGR